ncbi:histone deacetylase family protein [Patescibacteria group bacterium]|nr:histone deacetylase family protein [Patescibacteria group bacterium]MBU1868024.1 histone deacetylase family protein [Patescibacteria group bacterium]
MLKIIWTPEYLKYDFGPDHPFWPQRGREFLELIKQSPIEYKIVSPPPASDKDILLVHTPDYLDKVKKSAKLSSPLSLDTPLNPGVLETAYYSVGGTIVTCEIALKGEMVINLLGGLHHAETNRGGGFCIFSDHAIAIRKLQKQGKLKKVLIFDLDVHAGNGTQEIFYSDPSVFNISLHQDPATLYPGTGFAHQRGIGKGKDYNLNIPLPPGTNGSDYLQALDQVLPLYNNYQSDLTILILGVDTYKNDPLANLNLVENDYLEIGKRFSRFPKLAVLCAGGYSRQTPELWLEFLKGQAN